MLLFLISHTFNVTFPSETQKFTALNIPLNGSRTSRTKTVKVSYPVISKSSQASVTVGRAGQRGWD